MSASGHESSNVRPSWTFVVPAEELIYPIPKRSWRWIHDKLAAAKARTVWRANLGWALVSIGMSLGVEALLDQSPAMNVRRDVLAGGAIVVIAIGAVLVVADRLDEMSSAATVGSVLEFMDHEEEPLLVAQSSGSTVMVPAVNPDPSPLSKASE